MAGMIESYLIELKHELHLPAALKARILAEVSDHLYEAFSAEQAGEIEAEEAVRRVLQRFGLAKEVARGFLLDSATSETYLAAKALPVTEVALIAFSFLRARTQPPGPWPHDVLPAQLTFFVNSATLAFLIALLASLFLCWQLWLYRKRPLAERAIPLILGVALFTVLALLTDGIAYSIFTFQRAAVVPHSSSLLILSLLAAAELSLILTGSFFVFRAVLRYQALRKVHTN